VIIRMEERADLLDLHHDRWELGIIGSAVDDRGTAAIGFVTSNAAEIRTAHYLADQFTLQVNGNAVLAEEVMDFFAQDKGRSVLIEATTLGLVESLLIIRGFYELGASRLSICYVEPKGYTNPRHSHLVHRREFELSQEVQGYKPVPGAVLVTTERTSQRAIFFLGYEERRLDVALDEPLVVPADTAVVFGVPAFNPGWEMNAFANNVRVIRDNSIGGGIYYCGAENPAAAFGILEEVYASLLSDERLLVGPIGTKPNGIGAALFIATHRDVGLLYDHPRRSSKRSTEVARWHLFSIEF